MKRKFLITLTMTTLFSTFFIQPAMAEICDYEPNTDAIVSYKFNDIDLESIMMLASHVAGTEIIGLELVKDKMVSVAAEKVNVTAFVDALLLINGFGFVEQDKSWIISKM